MAIAFIAGKLVTSRESDVASKESANAIDQAINTAAEQSSGSATPDKVSGKTSESTSAPFNAAASKPHGATQPTVTYLSPEAAREVLARVPRRELYQWIAEDEQRLDRFKETDAQFGSRKKMSEADWKRLLELATVKGAIRFKFESAHTSELRIEFKNKTVSLAVRYRKSDSKSPDDFSTSRSSWNIGNGRGVGLTSDSSGYFIVMANPMHEPGWVEYSNFALSVPFDRSGKSEMTVDVIGLTEDLKWEIVGSAVIKREN